MKKINVEGGGFPGTSRTWRHIAEMIEQNAQLATTIAGNNAIVSGLETSGTSSVTDGLVVLAGEFYPVIGGNVALYNAYLSVVENVDQVQYLKDEDGDGAGDLIDTYFDRYAIVTSVSAGNTKLTDLTRLNTLKELSKRIPPQQTALPYYGSINAIPQGWQLCDGTNGTPDLSGMFVVGYDPNDTYHDQIGKNGGEKIVTLTKAQMPQHNHDGTTDQILGHQHDHYDSITIQHVQPPNGHWQYDYVGQKDGNNGGIDADNDYIWKRNNKTKIGGAHSHSFTTNNKGGNLAHENRPPYFTMAWITYTG
mgnify:CR=1 FL=1